MTSDDNNVSPVRIVIAGCGMITATAHLPAVLSSRKARLVGLVDADIHQPKMLARRYALDVRISDNLETLLDAAEAVVVAVPSHLHAPVAKLALSRGIPVLVEKPLTVQVNDALQLCEIAEQNRTFISVGYYTRHYPAVRLMKHLLDTRYFGAIRKFQFEFGTRGGWAPVSGYNLDRSSGGGVLSVVGTHSIDRMLYWFGKPRAIEFQDDSYGGPEANCKARVWVERDSYVLEGTLTFSKTAPLKNFFAMETEAGRVEMLASETDHFSLLPRSEPSIRLQVGTREPAPMLAPDGYFQQQMEEFADCVRGRRVPSVDGRFATESVRLVSELYAVRTQLPEPWMRYHRNEKTLAA